jgi:hypothetical protein
MRNQVWKYELKEVGEQSLTVPKGAKPLSVDMQRGTLRRGIGECCGKAIDLQAIDYQKDVQAIEFL